MPVPTLNGLPPFADFDMLKTKINALTTELNNLLVNLDTLNIVELNAKVITAGTITADKMDVDELSAISANLGHITAGLIESIRIFGSYIATRNGTYPRAEMSNTNNLFAAAFNSTAFIRMIADYGGAPALEFIAGGVVLGRMNMLFSDLEIYGANGISFNGGQVKFLNWNRILNLNTGATLGQELDKINILEDQLQDKSDVQAAATNMAFDPVSRNLKLFNAYGDQIAIVNIP